MSKTLTVKEIATQFETDPRTLRKFLRSEQGMNAKVGKGHRWAIEARKVNSLRKRFDAWNAPKVDETE